MHPQAIAKEVVRKASAVTWFGREAQESRLCCGIKIMMDNLNSMMEHKIMLVVNW